ncbi:Uncharacterised protein [Streptomyces griseus]|nr:Uncharacterised protein [Streptomyces griseus]
MPTTGAFAPSSTGRTLPDAALDLPKTSQALPRARGRESLAVAAEMTWVFVTHERLVAEHTGSFDGVRFSITPYTLGFAGRPGTDRQAYVDNLAAGPATARRARARRRHGRVRAPLHTARRHRRADRHPPGRPSRFRDRPAPAHLPPPKRRRAAADGDRAPGRSRSTPASTPRMCTSAPTTPSRQWRPYGPLLTPPSASRTRPGRCGCTASPTPTARTGPPTPNSTRTAPAPPSSPEPSGSPQPTTRPCRTWPGATRTAPGH